MGSGLISRRALIKTLDHARLHGIGIRDAVKSVPDEDAELVQYAQWVQDDTYRDRYFCGACLSGDYRGKPKHKYCPECGRRMDAQEDT